MPSHATFIAIIVLKENYNSLAQGLAKYQTAENDFKIINWKYFYPFNQPHTEFSTVYYFSYACIIATGNPEQVFEASKILISTPHCMFPVQIICEQKEVGESTYFDTKCYQYNSHTNSKKAHMKLRAFYPTNVPRFACLRTNNNIRMGRTFIISEHANSSSSDASNNCSDIDLIIEDVDLSTPQLSKRPCRITSKYSNKSTNLSPVNIEPATSILTLVNPVNLNSGM
ncbi:19044_t:CDS:2, partial [Gigaspora margarita]